MIKIDKEQLDWRFSPHDQLAVLMSPALFSPDPVNVFSKQWTRPTWEVLGASRGPPSQWIEPSGSSCPRTGWKSADPRLYTVDALNSMSFQSGLVTITQRCRRFMGTVSTCFYSATALELIYLSGWWCNNHLETY